MADLSDEALSKLRAEIGPGPILVESSYLCELIDEVLKLRARTKVVEAEALFCSRISKGQRCIYAPLHRDSHRFPDGHTVEQS
jgi:hypothetical protein